MYVETQELTDFFDSLSFLNGHYLTQKEFSPFTGRNSEKTRKAVLLVSNQRVFFYFDFTEETHYMIHYEQKFYSILNLFNRLAPHLTPGQRTQIDRFNSYNRFADYQFNPVFAMAFHQKLNNVVMDTVDNDIADHFQFEFAVEPQTEHAIHLSATSFLTNSAEKIHINIDKLFMNTEVCMAHPHLFVDRMKEVGNPLISQIAMQNDDSLLLKHFEYAVTHMSLVFYRKTKSYKLRRKFNPSFNL